MTTTLAITGGAGRMGQRLVVLAHADKDLNLVAAIERDGHAAIGRDDGTAAHYPPSPPANRPIFLFRPTPLPPHAI